MRIFIRNLFSYLVHFVWMVQLYFAKSQTTQRCNGRQIKPNMANLTNSTNDLKPRLTRTAKSSSHLLFNLTNNSKINLSDLMTPMEEEMLRCLCAKGYTKSYKKKKYEEIGELVIPRDTFTNIWIDSCCTV